MRWGELINRPLLFSSLLVPLLHATHPITPVHIPHTPQHHQYWEKKVDEKIYNLRKLSNNKKKLCTAQNGYCPQAIYFHFKKSWLFYCVLLRKDPQRELQSLSWTQHGAHCFNERKLMQVISTQNFTNGNSNKLKFENCLSYKMVNSFLPVEENIFKISTYTGWLKPQWKSNPITAWAQSMPSFLATRWMPFTIKQKSDDKNYCPSHIVEEAMT